MHWIVKICCVVGLAYVFDVTVPEQLAARRAKKANRLSKKPMLNVGSGTDSSSFTGAKYRGDVNCDLAAPKNAPCGRKSVCHCDIQRLPFKDKEFGVALAANVLQYAPDQHQALRELDRVADTVIITDAIIPWVQLGPGHSIRRNVIPLKI
jgi:ubiquinone/menaquinone biosynthesis C-methylase UbiE